MNKKKGELTNEGKRICKNIKRKKRKRRNVSMSEIKEVVGEKKKDTTKFTFKCRCGNLQDEIKFTGNNNIRCRECGNLFDVIGRYNKDPNSKKKNLFEYVVRIKPTVCRHNVKCLCSEVTTATSSRTGRKFLVVDCFICNTRVTKLIAGSTIDDLKKPVNAFSFDENGNVINVPKDIKIKAD